MLAYASVVSWNVWQHSFLKGKIQISLGTKSIVYHLNECVFIQKVFTRFDCCRLGTYSTSHKLWLMFLTGFPAGSNGKESTSNAGDLDLTPGSGRSPGKGHGNPLQYSCLEDPRTEEPDGLLSMWSQRVRHDWATKYTCSPSSESIFLACAFRCTIHSMNGNCKKSYLDHHHFLNRRRQWHPTPVLLPGKSHGQRSLVVCSPWGL